MSERIYRDQKLTETITIPLEIYQDLITKCADYDSIHAIASMVPDDESALEAIKSVLGVWDR